MLETRVKIRVECNRKARATAARPNARTMALNKMAGEVGIEPTNAGIKIRCLTTWRLPKGSLASALSGRGERVKRVPVERTSHETGDRRRLRRSRQRVHGGVLVGQCGEYAAPGTRHRHPRATGRLARQCVETGSNF